VGVVGTSKGQAVIFGIPPAAVALIGTTLILAASDDGEAAPIYPDAIQLKPPKSAGFELQIAGHQRGKNSGPLPEQAIIAGAQNAFNSKTNNIHTKGAWFNYGVYSSKFFQKIDKLRFYSRPPGPQYVVSNSDTANLCWAARCPDSWYPQYGYRNRSCRISELKRLIGFGAEVKSFFGGVKDLFAELPEILESAGLVAGAVATGGQSANVDAKGQIDQVEETIEGIIDAPAGWVNDIKARKKAAGALVTALMVQYREQIARANPWVIQDGKVVLGKRFKANPKTYADLYAPGNARPLLYSPPRDIEGAWPNR